MYLNPCMIFSDQRREIYFPSWKGAPSNSFKDKEGNHFLPAQKPFKLSQKMNMCNKKPFPCKLLASCQVQITYFKVSTGSTIYFWIPHLLQWKFKLQFWFSKMVVFFYLYKIQFILTMPAQPSLTTMLILCIVLLTESCKPQTYRNLILMGSQPIVHGRNSEFTVIQS